VTTAISGTRRQYKEMADGTIRVSIDVDPRFKKEFLELFPEIDTPVALAPLALDFEKKEEEKPKGGPLSKSAAMLCEDERFQEFLRSAHKDDWNCFDCVTVDDQAAHVVRLICGVASRAGLDHIPEAAKSFHELMREYRQWSDLGETG
jgi:hypothetical protein